LKVFQLPVVVGLSRKSMIWKVLDTDPENSLNGTTVVNTMALLGGADILRVHDVKPAVEALRIFMQLKDTL
jgi:dihydropteroate synthase